jgi:hypothetical protein
MYCLKLTSLILLVLITSSCYKQVHDVYEPYPDKYNRPLINESNSDSLYQNEFEDDDFHAYEPEINEE